MLYCPADKKIYATADSSAPGALANSVSRVNPVTGGIEASVFVGDDPRKIIQTDDGQFLYVLTAKDKRVCQIDRATLKMSLAFPIDDGFAARLLIPVPGLPKAVLVARYNPMTSPTQDNLRVYVSGKATKPALSCSDEVGIGIDPSRIITNCNYGSSMYVLGATGVMATDTARSFSGLYSTLNANGFGLIIMRDGEIVDPEARQILGRLPDGGGAECIDPVRPVVYQVSSDRKPIMRAYDLRTFQKLWEIPLPNWDGHHDPAYPMRWGEGNFAYVDGGYIVVADLQLGPPANWVDLSVARSAVPKNALPGRVFHYTLTVKNNSDFPSTGAFLTETLPVGIEVVEAKATQGTALESEHVIRAELGPIPAHESATVKITLRIGEMGSDGFVAVVRSYDPDPNTANNIVAPKPAK